MDLGGEAKTGAAAFSGQVCCWAADYALFDQHFISCPAFGVVKHGAGSCNLNMYG
jgi:hypothetical protein